MDKETLSNYGWIVICTLVLAVMIALAGPFGNFIAGAIQSTTQGLFDVNQNALDSAGIQIMEQEFETMLNGNNGATVPDGFTYTDAITEEVLGAGQQLPSKLTAGSHLTQIEGDYTYLLMKTGFETLEEARAYCRAYVENQSGGSVTWEEYVDSYFGDEEVAYELFTDANIIGVGLTEETFVPDNNPSYYWSVGAKDRTKSTYGTICTKLLDYNVTDMNSTFWNCSNLVDAPTIPNSIIYIGNTAFMDCINLTNISIPNSVISLGSAIFSGCTSLTTVTFEGTVSQWNTISKHEDWNSSCGELTIVCSDGTITVPADE